jgi:hypothetical protein
MALVTLAAAKTHIKADWLTTSPADARDAELQEIVDQASDHIFGYLKKPVTSPPYWDETTAPPRVRSMTLLMVGHLWEHRGDDMQDVDEAVWEAIQRLGVRDQTSALA